MASTDPRADSPHRRVFNPADKLAHLAAYEQARETNEGGTYLPREGLYSSLINEWRKRHDAGVLDGKQPGTKIGTLTAEQAEIARLEQELARANKRLTTTKAALDIMGKAHALLESLSERADFDDKLTATWYDLTAAGGVDEASTCVRCLRYTGRCVITRRSANVAGLQNTRRRPARSWSPPHRGRCTRATSPNSPDLRRESTSTPT